MTASWWNGRQITASSEDRQQKEDVPLEDAGAGNEMQHSRIQTFWKNEYITCM